MISKVTGLLCLVMILQIDMASFASFFKTRHFSVISVCHTGVYQNSSVHNLYTSYQMLEVLQNEILMSLKNHNKKDKTQIHLN